MSAKLLDEAVRLLRSGDAQQAAALCRRVVDSADSASTELAEAHSLLGLALLAEDPQSAHVHLSQAVSADPAEPQFRMNLARGLVVLHRPDEAETEFRKAVDLSDRHVGPLLALARFLLDQKRASEAEGLVREILAGHPEHRLALRMLAEVHYEAGDYFGANDLLEKLFGPAPERPRDALLLARIAQQVHDYDRARSLLDRVLAREPTNPEAVAMANMLSVWLGDADRHEEMLRRSLAANPDNAALIPLRIESGNLSQNELRQFHELSADESRAPADRAGILYALSQHHDRAGEYDLAWNCAVKASALERGERRPGSGDELRMRRESLLSRARSIAREIEPDEGASVSNLVYLCGAPRTGGSLVQSILAAAPGVKSVGERAALLPHLLGLADGQGGNEGAVSLGDLRAADLRGLARLDPNAHSYVDKTPQNIQVAGLIAAVHPRARFMAMLRDPADTLVSILIRSFPPAFDYSYDPQTICDYLLFHAEAVAGWLEDGLDLLAVSYADFVGDPVAQGRRIAGWGGIDWSPDYLDPARRTQPVATFSARQVRQPIAISPVRREHAYASQLAPFERTLDRIREIQSKLLIAADELA